ncbi:MAG: sulfite exporter TauE/SafE family protein [Marmoricola sp.]
MPRLSDLAALAVFVAGIAAGMINTIVGSGTLVTFPTLLAVGLPPVTANVSNALGLVPGSLSGAWGYRRELRGQGRRMLWLAPATTLGAIVGALLLLRLPSAAFDAIVPALIALGVLLVVIGPWLNRRLAARRTGAARERSPGVWAGVLGTGVYGGYFGAAQGVLLMAIFGIGIDDDVQRHNALKNVLSALVNAIAALIFIIVAHIDWTVAGLLAVGSALGGQLGATIGRRLPPLVLRVVIVVVGVVAIVSFVH